MVYPVFVPSKARSNSIDWLYQSLLNSQAEFYFVVEPQDRENYQELIDNRHIILLPKNNQGITYVRQFILDYNRQNKPPWYWMLDDDITGFYQTIDNRNKPVTLLTALEESEKIFIKNRVAIAALEYQQYAWSAKKTYTLNGYCDVCVCINTANTRLINYRKEVELKEDRDFVLQALNKGYLSLRVQKYSFKAPKNGSNEGGLYEIYRSGMERKQSLKMCQLWGKDICTMHTKKDGRQDVKINWRHFNSFEREIPARLSARDESEGRN